MSFTSAQSAFHEVWFHKVIGRDVWVWETTTGSGQELPPKNWGKKPSLGKAERPHDGVIVVVVVVVV